MDSSDVEMAPVEQAPQVGGEHAAAPAAPAAFGPPVPLMAPPPKVEDPWAHLEAIARDLDKKMMELGEGYIVAEDPDKKINVLKDIRRLIPRVSEYDDLGALPTLAKINALREAGALYELMFQLRYDVELNSWTNSAAVWAYVANLLTKPNQLPVGIYIPRRHMSGSLMERAQDTENVGDYSMFFTPIRVICRVFLEEQKKLCAAKGQATVSAKDVGASMKKKFRCAVPGRVVNENNAHRWQKLNANLFDIHGNGQLKPLYEAYARCTEKYAVCISCPFDGLHVLDELLTHAEPRVLIDLFNTFEDIDAKAKKAHEQSQAEGKRRRTDFKWTAAMLLKECQLIRLRLDMVAKLQCACTDIFNPDDILLVSENDTEDHARMAHLEPREYRMYLVYRASVEQFWDIRRSQFLQVLDDKNGEIDNKMLRKILLKTFTEEEARMIFEAPRLGQPEEDPNEKRKEPEEDEEEEVTQLTPYEWAFSDSIHPWPMGEHYRGKDPRKKDPKAPEVIICEVDDLERIAKQKTMGRGAFYFCDYSRVTALTERDSVEPKKPLVHKKAVKHMADGMAAMRNASANPLYFFIPTNIETEEPITKEMKKLTGCKKGTIVYTRESWNSSCHKKMDDADLTEPFVTNMNGLPRTFWTDLSDQRTKLLTRSCIDLKQVEDSGCPIEFEEMPIQYQSISDAQGKPVEQYSAWFTRMKNWTFYQTLRTQLLKQTNGAVPVVVDLCMDEMLCAFCILMKMDYIGVPITPAHEAVKKNAARHLWWWAKTYSCPLEHVSDQYRIAEDYIKYTKREITPLQVRVMEDFIEYNLVWNKPAEPNSRSKNAATAINMKRPKMSKEKAAKANAGGNSLLGELLQLQQQNQNNNDDQEQ
ncbi:unnamed protein product [Amoebophrya sp. A25]|nr:unnamed protein product [Amoebophrya sp. A25]|eukprot:GSA25T00007916001.1